MIREAHPKTLFWVETALRGVGSSGYFTGPAGRLPR